jgi:serine/threonine protein kinase
VSKFFSDNLLKKIRDCSASGGELLESLTKQEYVTESEIAGYIRQVLLGLEHMHSQNIAHLGLTVIT